MNIAIIGNTGAGKSTFARQLAEKYKGTDLVFGDMYKIIEDTYDGKYLKEFYRNPYSYAYENEMEFLLKYIKDIALISTRSGAKHVLLDRSFLDVTVFIKAMKKIDILEDDEYKILNQYSNLTTNIFLKEIDLIIYMRCGTELLHNNILQRSREFEVDNHYSEVFIELMFELNKQLDDLVYELARDKKATIIQFDDLSKNSLDSVEYNKALDLVHTIAEKVL